MKICFPVSSLNGLESPVYAHFGSAPGFVIVDTENRNVDEIDNNDLHHAHGMCQPLKALGGREVDAVAVGGIGMGALMKLQAQGIRVFRAAEGTVEENAGLIAAGRLPEFDPELTCAGHAGGGCAH
jgi:predicted Fe-Mo cluster-binding NifX family protein